MAKAEIGSGTPLELRLDPNKTVTDAELAEYVYKETGISPDWYPCILQKKTAPISQERSLNPDLQPQHLPSDLSEGISR